MTRDCSFRLKRPGGKPLKAGERVFWIAGQPPGTISRGDAALPSVITPIMAMMMRPAVFMPVRRGRRRIMPIFPPVPGRRRTPSIPFGVTRRRPMAERVRAVDRVHRHRAEGGVHIHRLSAATGAAVSAHNSMPATTIILVFIVLLLQPGFEDLPPCSAAFAHRAFEPAAASGPQRAGRCAGGADEPSCPPIPTGSWRRDLSPDFRAQSTGSTPTTMPQPFSLPCVSLLCGLCRHMTGTPPILCLHRSAAGQARQWT